MREGGRKRVGEGARMKGGKKGGAVIKGRMDRGGLEWSERESEVYLLYFTVVF